MGKAHDLNPRSFIISESNLHCLRILFARTFFLEVMEMIKVLFVISDRNIGGAGVLLCNLLRHSDRREFQCSVALPFGSELRERLLELKVSIWELQHACDTLNSASVWELISVIRKCDADIVHANAAVSARMAGKICRKKVIHTRHCCFPIPKRGIVRRVAENLGNRSLSDLVIATSQSAAENLVELGISKKKIRIVLNGSDPVREVSDEELRDLREEWELTEEDFCVGICARLEPCKGHSVFLRGAERMKQMNLPRNLKFLVIGEGSQRSRLEQNIRALGLEEKVKLVGFVRDMAPVYRLLRINVNCSCGTETSCLAISEGMSASLPTIATDYGGNRVMIGEDGAGILIPVGDDSALADAIRKIACDEVVERQMGEAAYQRYLAHFTAARMTERTQEIYRTLMSKNTK